MSRIRDVILRGTRAAQPAASSVDVGVLYYVTDESVTERSNGSTWDTYADGSVVVSAGTTSTTAKELVFSNSNGVSFGINASTITASISPNAQVNFSAGTTSNNLMSVVFSNSNGISFGLNGSTITGSLAAGIANVNLSAGTTSNNLTNFVLSNSNNVSFGLNGSTVTATVTVATSLTNINVSAGTTSGNLSAVTFSNSNGVSFGLNGSVITASANGGGGNTQTMSYFRNYPFIISTEARGTVGNSEMYLMPIEVPYNLSASYARIIVSLSNPQNANFAGTTANTSFSGGQSFTHGLVLFSYGTGASSNSLMSVITSSGGRTIATSVTENTTSQWTVSIMQTYQLQGKTSTFSTSYGGSSASFNISSSAMQSFSGYIFQDVPFATSFGPGVYVMGYAINQSSTRGNGPSGFSQGTQGYSHAFILGINALPLLQGTTKTDMLVQGQAIYTTNSAFFTTAGIDLSNISSVTSNDLLALQLINRA